MALIDCPECGREISSSADLCPACAYPVRTGTPPLAPRAIGEPPKQQWWKTAVSMAGRVILGAVIAGVGGDEEGSAMAIVGGLIIAGSAVPTWYRAKIDSLKAGRAANASQVRVADQAATLLQQQQIQMDRLEQMHVEQMADLEERLDFAERLLTKQSAHPPSPRD